MNEPNPSPINIINQQRPESGTVTALAVISMVFGAIGLLGSFVPCLGALAIWVAVPAALCGGISFFLARSKNVSIGLPVAAFVISLLGVVISGVQILTLGSFVHSGVQEAKRQQQLQQQQQSALPSASPTDSPAASATP